MAAPSAVAEDPWAFLVVRDQTCCRSLPKVCRTEDARRRRLGIVVCGDLRRAHDRQLSYLLQDCSAAIENLLLGREYLGLGACWPGVHPRTIAWSTSAPC